MHHGNGQTSGNQKTVATAAGFTLIELMVTLIVIGVVAAIAYPAFTSFVTAERLTGSANDLVTDLQYARSEAIRRNTRVTMCATTDNATCEAAASPWQDWIVLANNSVLRSGHAKTPLKVTASSDISGNKNSVVFRPDGMARKTDGSLLGATITTCIVTTTPPENVRSIDIASGSRISTTRANGSGACT